MPLSQGLGEGFAFAKGSQSAHTRLAFVSDKRLFKTNVAAREGKPPTGLSALTGSCARWEALPPRLRESSGRPSLTKRTLQPGASGLPVPFVSRSVRPVGEPHLLFPPSTSLITPRKMPVSKIEFPCSRLLNSLLAKNRESGANLLRQLHFGRILSAAEHCMSRNHSLAAPAMPSAPC